MLGYVTKNRLRAETEKARHESHFDKGFNMLIRKECTVIGLKANKKWSFVDLDHKDFNAILGSFLNEIEASEKI